MKFQAPSSREAAADHRPNANSADWLLELEYSLEFGCWILELFRFVWGWHGLAIFASLFS
jgi:hypothetical protein